MSRAKFVQHVNIQTTNRARTKEWYEKVFDAEAIERGNAPNRGQLQVKFGTWEIHFSETTSPVHAPLVHFAVEVDDWDEMLAHLDRLGIAYGKTMGLGRAGTFRESRGGNDPRQGRREHDGSHYTYMQDPDGNVIELVHHPKG
jgi:catechol 2,3-dioxygenase-like lactoylglutathione lyase family enzyme